ncbi:MAG: type II toxin-antitoxin system HicA family toxin [Pseudomonadota bacterium]
MKSRDIIRAIRDEGWWLDRIVGSHHHFRHDERPGTTTVIHPKKDISIGTVKSIEKQSGVKLRRRRT